MPALVRHIVRPPLLLAQRVFDRLPAETKMHARAAAHEGAAALRSLADGTTDATERAIDRIAGIINKR